MPDQRTYTPTGNAFTDVKSKQPVWGETVNVPEHSDPPSDPTTKWTRENGDGTVNQGKGNNNENDNQDGNQDGGDDTITEPTVFLPDGTKVVAKEYFAQAFSAKEAELTQKENRLDGMMELTRSSNGNGNANGEGGDDNNETPDDNKPSFEKMEFPEGTTPEANETFLAGEYNKVVDALNAREEFWSAKDSEKQAAIDKLTEDFKNLSDVVGRDQWQNAMTRVIAVTGVKEEELMAKYRETRIADADTLASLVLGDREKERILKETSEQAENERQQGTNAVGSQSTGSGNQGGGNSNAKNEPYRGLNPDTDYTAEKLVTKYNLISYDPNQPSA